METANLTSSAAPGQRNAVRQIGRGLLALALILQGLFSLGFGLYGIWAGVSWIGGPPYLVGWAWYQPLTVGVFLALGGAVSLIACWTFAKDEPEPALRQRMPESTNTVAVVQWPDATLILTGFEVWIDEGPETRSV